MRLVLAALLVAALLISPGAVLAGNPTSIQVEVEVPICGNSVVEQGESCDPPGTLGGVCGAGSTCSSECACGPVSTNASVSLQAGLNLVSIPLVAGDVRYGELLSSIAADYNAVFLLNAGNESTTWTSHIPARPGYFNLSIGVPAQQGFWIDMSSAATLQVSGTNDEAVRYSIRQGWNLISFPWDSSENADDSFDAVEDIVESVYEYDAAELTPWTWWRPNDGASTLTSLTPGLGYFVYATEDDLWRFEDGAYVKDLADLKITSIATDPIFPAILDGQTTLTTGVVIAVHNDGAREARNVDVKLYVVIDGVETLLTTFTFESIGPGEIVHTSDLSPVTFLQEFDLEGGTHYFRAEIDPGGTIDEENEGNNVFQRTLEVVPPLAVTIARSLSSTTVPSSGVFSPTVVGGYPPYSYFWFPSDTTDVRPLTSELVSPRLLFSKDGSRGISVFVTDIRGNTAGALDSFSLGTHPASNQMDFDVAITSLNFNATDPTQVDIDLTANNTGTGTHTGLVRLTLTIFDRDDLSRLNLTIYDELVHVTPGGSYSPATITSPSLANGNYTAAVRINDFAPVPEAPGDLSDNGFNQDFEMNDASTGPPLEITALTLDPFNTTAGQERPVVADRTALTVTVKNNSPVRRSVLALFYYYDRFGVKQQIITTGTAESVDPGAEIDLPPGRWFADSQREVEVLVNLVDLVSSVSDPTQRPVLAAFTRFVDVEPFTFNVSNLVVCQYRENENDCVTSPLTTNIRLHYFADVTNASPVPGDVIYKAQQGFDDVFEGRVAQLGPGETERVHASFSGSPGIGIRAAMVLEPIVTENFVRDMYLDPGGTTVVSNTVTATQVDGCGLQDIEVPEFPVMGVSHDISITVRKDASPTDDGVALFALDIYDNWPGNTGNPAIVTQQFVQTLSKIDRQKRTVSWTPSVPGPHTLQFDCGNTTEFATAFVTPEVVFPAHTAANPRVVTEGSGWDFAYRDDGVVPAVTDTNDYRFGFEGLLLKRISAWAYAEGTGFIDQGEDSADFDFTLRKTFRLDDKTGSSDLYTGKLIIDLGWMGWADQVDYAVGDASYQVTGYIGVEEVGTDPEDVSKTCGDDKQLPCRSVVFQKPTANDEFADAAVDILLTGFRLFPPTAGAATVAEIAVAIASAVICEGQFFNLFASRPRARHGDLRHPFELEDIPLRNGVEYNLYLRVKTSLWAEGPGESYSDFYDHDPQNCFDSSRMEGLRDSDLWTPGLWIDFITIEPESKSP